MSKESKRGGQLKKFWRMMFILVTVVWLVMFFVFPSDARIFWGTIKILLFDYWWLIFPLPLWYVYHMMWMERVVGAWLGQREYVLLELIPPKDIEKSPKLMEHVFAGVNDYSTPNRLEFHCGWRILQPRWSFEIVGEEGSVHYYVRCVKPARHNLEAQVYAHYPDMIIKEVEDYTKKAPHNIPNARWDVWGATLDLVKPDPVPIRTYKQFQEEVTGTMIDPLSNVIEVMGSLPKGQHIWLQIVLESEKPPNWHPASQAYIQQIIDEYIGKKQTSKKNPILGVLGRFWHEISVLPRNIASGVQGGELVGPRGGGEGDGNVDMEFNINKLPPGVQETIKAISDNISKPGFRTVIRFVYFGVRDGYNKALGVAGMMGAFNQFGDINLNDLVPSAMTKTFANYYFDEERLLRRKRKIIADYKSRSGAGMWYIMNTEELATIYHFPDVSVKSQAITRMESKKEEAPANLPVDTVFQEDINKQ